MAVAGTLTRGQRRPGGHKQFVKILYEAAKAGGDPDRVRATKCFLSSQKINNLIKLASSDPSILQDARDFDAKPSLLNVQNGTIDFSSGKIEFRPHDAADLLMKCADVAYDPEASCPMFDDLLESILSPEDGAFVLRLMGYAMSGTFDQQTFAIFHGAGGEWEIHARQRDPATAWQLWPDR